MTITDGTTGYNGWHWRSVVAVGLLTVSSLAWSHTHVTATHPVDGEVLQESPERIAVEFDSPLRMTQFEIAGSQGKVELREDSIGSMATQHEGVPAEPLAPGEYQVEWRGLAEDGHDTSGDFGFTIDE
ncbi:copper resistance CopC family protein [Aidingimonas halophila]|uniref:CopC domain-containing protein n=1 Tax=Aidingimonas halophila TaxID=574349 RepID=A0A1H3FIF8_9GAMM|nr:copper resistance CopC family protein [Aidingimonas halophila]GHC37951.1 hypothetical protein GCM10008094_34120 [Aidingimonas halophila]SDX89899.1 hypothetical protein SAMN05443545_10816 [Aidingimonas halophila]